VPEFKNENMNKYVIVSPVRNEEDFLRTTMESVVNQTVKPAEWILVNDGSTDATEAIIDSYMKEHEWIKKINLQDRGYYYPGTGVVRVFEAGFDQISVQDWEYVVKLDCDLKFEPTYFEEILKRFANDPNLGIASGCTYAPKENELIREPAQEDHPVGPSKIYKRECWEQTGGMLPVPGWDLADLLAAQMNGWQTKCFFDLKLIHYRQTGARRKGLWAPKFLQGRFTYKHGYSFIYTLVRELSHLFRKPYIIGSFAQICGYLYASIKKEDYLFPKEMRDFLRNRHRKFLKSKFGLN
jgi:glycosyltransferase involved in cell wall biosynthesis